MNGSVSSCDPDGAWQVDIQRTTPQEAVVALVIAGARADGTVSPSEADRIEHSVAVMRLFRGYSHEALRSIFATAMKRIQRDGSAALLRAASYAIPAELRATVFAMTV